MKKLFVIGLCILSLSSFSQKEWELIHGSDSIINIGGVCMIDTTHIWAKGIYFSPDWGKTWEQQFYHEDYSYSDIFFADNLNGWTVGWSEVLHTSDAGENWALQSVPNPLGLDLEAVFFLNPDTGWIASSYRAIYVTYDGGTNWTTQHNYNLSGNYFLYDIHFYDADHGCAVGGGLLSDVPIIITTGNGGKDWTESFPSGDKILRSVQYVNDSVVWCCDSYGTLYRSTDGGFNWGVVQSIPGIWPYDMHFFDETHAIIGGNSSRMATTSDAWSTYQVQELYWQNRYGNFSFGDGLEGIAAGFDNILRTIDGGFTWKRLNDRFSRIAFFSPDNGWIIQEHLNKNLMHSTDGGFTWTEVDLNHLGYLLQITVLSEQVAFAVTNLAELLKTTDAGSSWEITKLPLDSGYYADIQFLDENTGYLILHPNKLLKTLNGGHNWETINFDTLNYITSMDFINESEGWIAGSQGFAGHTIDGGQSWNSVALPSYSLRDVDFITNLTGFIISNSGPVYRTNDGGITWDEIELSLNFAENIYFTDTLNGWITDKFKVYRTFDSGNSWIEELDANTSNFEDQITGFYAIDTNSAWFCTMDGRVFSFSGFLSTEEINEKHGITFYPNPVSDRLTIELNNELSDKLSLSVFSIDGRLIIERQFSGMQEERISIDLSALSSGLYILNFQGVGNSESIKLIKK